MLSINSSSSIATRLSTLAIFCKVVDNYGDIGICWRLSRQFRREHDIAVTLWVDDLHSFKWICPEITPDCAVQQIQEVTVRHWRDLIDEFDAADVADLVIEFFGCDIPSAYIRAMSQRMPRPVWLNLEGLTAETWVEGCHTLPSPHPQLPLTKYFFFPGFNARTGGLQHEAGIDRQRLDFLNDTAAQTAFLMQFGVTTAEIHALRISLFCYPQAPVADLFAVWANGAEAVVCLVPEGVAREAVEDFLGEEEAVAGAAATHGALTVRVLPFVPQADYDKLLWACDLNFVRGEDSFVRAQWAGKPFIWHIYPQDQHLHHVKLDAFLRICTAVTDSAKAMMLAWNRVGSPSADVATLWSAFAADLAGISRVSDDWRKALLANGDLTANLLKFAETVR